MNYLSQHHLLRKSFFFLTLLIFFGISSGSFASDNFQLVSASELPPIENKFARKYLSGQKATWPDGSPVIIVLLPSGSPEMTWMCKSLIRMSEATYRRFIMEKSFRGGLKIIEVTTKEEAIIALKANHGSVAPMSSGNLSNEIFVVPIK